MMKLACATMYDAQDPSGMAARVYAHLQALREQVAAMHFVGPLRLLRHSWFAPILLGKSIFYNRIRKQLYLPKSDSLVIKDQARQIARRLTGLDYDIVLSPLSPGSMPISYLDCKKPIVSWTDANFAPPLFAAWFDQPKLNICSETMRDAMANDRAALSRVRLAIYYSDWGAKFAIDHHGLDPRKARVVTPGPTFEPEIDLSEAKEIIAARSRSCCRLLFLGMRWTSKGGDLALEVARRLNAAGLRTELTVVGCRPPVSPLPEFVRVTGYVSRSTREGARRLDALMRESHFLILPTRAEALGLVFSEAAAYALPALATAVGGVPSVVRDGTSGRLFPADADATPYRTYIDDVFSTYERYQDLALSTFADFHSRLSNRVVAEKLVRTLQEVV